MKTGRIIGNLFAELQQAGLQTVELGDDFLNPGAGLLQGVAGHAAGADTVAVTVRRDKGMVGFKIIIYCD